MSADPNVDSRTDRQLLARYRRAGDQSAFAILVSRYHALVLGVCRQTLGDQHDAEDAFQATFMVLAKDAARIRKAESLASWLYGVAYRISLQVRRKRARSVSIELEDRIVNQPEVCPLDRLTKLYENGIAHDELARLPSRLRAPLVLRYLDGKTNQEVATQLNLSEAAVEGRLKRAKAKLRARLTRHGVTLTVAIATFQAVRQSATAAESLTLLQRTVDQCLAAKANATNVDHDLLQLAREEIVAMTTTSICKLAFVGGITLGVATLAVSINHFAGTALASDPLGAAAEEVTDPSTNDPFAGPVTSFTPKVRVTSDPFGAETDEAAQPSIDNPFGGTPSPADAGVNADPFDSFTELARPAASLSTGALAAESGKAPKKRFDLYQRSAAEERIEQAMGDKTDLDFYESPLAEVVAYLNDAHDLRVVLDLMALEDVGITVDVPVTKTLEDLSLRSALNLMLRDLQLDYIVKDEALIITTPEVAESTMSTRLYKFDQRWPIPLQDLITTITSCTTPESWATTGGQGFISKYKNGMIIRQNQRVHAEISQLLTQLSLAIEE